ncbi:SDR family NAD(P)-dependent oxidoreductase [Alkalicoccus chagannorensis]|uniref:SDR family NAD(P)-dependent oxidoreductase n=1 Tax=Alkalicoccus chagannorensis TaxID=427072 RepID=UPI0003F73CCE|nr:SDR family NAD(P)-dependent oxidoreductase [Alkalicoccus chagannorensis]
MHDLHGKTALITGAANPKGIGRRMAEVLGEAGASIIVADIDKTYLDSSAEDLKRLGIEAVSYDMDAGDKSEVDRTIGSMLESYSIDILINNVGGTSKTDRESVSGGRDITTERKGPVLGISNATEEQWDKIMKVNVNSAFYCSQAVLPHMMERGQGCIVNFASIAGQRGVLDTETFTSGPYAVAKSAVIGMTKQLAVETAAYGIRVNAVAPGFIKSARGAALEELADEQKGALLNTVPMGRFGETEEIAQVVLGLCSNQFSYVTGQTVSINGGMYFSS